MSKDRELQRLIPIIHKTVVGADEGEKCLFKEAVDCCDYVSSTVDEEMGAQHEVRLLEKKTEVVGENISQNNLVRHEFQVD